MRTVAHRLERANELANLGRDTQAMEVLLQLLRSHPESAAAVEPYLARVHLIGGRTEEAREHARRAIALAPNQAIGHLLLGAALHGMNRCAEAVDPLQIAAGLDLVKADAPQRLAQVLTDLGRAPEAYAAANEALYREPHAAQSHFAMGYVLHHTQPEEAQRAYRQALTLDPHYTTAKHNLASVNLSRGDWDSASRGMADVLAESPSAQMPVFVLDQRLVRIIGWQHWLLFGTALGYGMVSSLGQPLANMAWLVGMVFLAAFLIRHGTRPLRAALPAGARHFLTGFPRRDVLTTLWAGLLAVGWLWLFVATIIAWVVDPDGLWTGLGVFVCLIAGVIVSWVRIPWAIAKAKRLRHEM